MSPAPKRGSQRRRSYKLVIRPHLAYLDTHIAEWLTEGKHCKLTSAARRTIEQCSLLISPISLLQVEYLFEIGRDMRSAVDVESQLRAELDVTLSPLPFPSITFHARTEKWTRYPFDRIIVAQARTSAGAPLISADEIVRKHDSPAVW